MAGLAPLRDEVAPPRRPAPDRGRGRPRKEPEEEPLPAPPIIPPVTPIERRAVDYSDLEQAMTVMDEAIRRTRQGLRSIGGVGPV